MVSTMDLYDMEMWLVAAVLTWFAHWLLYPLAYRFRLLDVPKGRKDHARPTPVIGGAAMALGVTVTAWCLLDEAGPALAGFSLGAGLLIAVGLLDDKLDLPWWLRICFQVIAALIMVYVGDVRVEHLGPVFGLGDTSLGVLSVPFTVFATVGLINAINMIDGSDGVAGSLVLTALVMLGAACVYSGNGGMAEWVLILIGAVTAFLAFNLRFPWRPRAKVFMGNAGSAFLGYCIAWVAFRLTQDAAHPVSPILALWLIPIPVMDCLVLMARRMRMGHSPFKADQNHVHHLLRAGGFSPTHQAAALSLFSGACGLAAGQAMRADVPHPWLLLAFFALCGGWYWLTARRQRAVDLFTRLRGIALPSMVYPFPQRRPGSTRMIETDGTARDRAA